MANNLCYKLSWKWDQSLLSLERKKLYDLNPKSKCVKVSILVWGGKSTFGRWTAIIEIWKESYTWCSSFWKGFVNKNRKFQMKGKFKITKLFLLYHLISLYLVIISYFRVIHQSDYAVNFSLWTSKPFNFGHFGMILRHLVHFKIVKIYGELFLVICVLYKTLRSLWLGWTRLRFT